MKNPNSTEIVLNPNKNTQIYFIFVIMTQLNRTPRKIPRKTPMKTPMETPMKTPKKTPRKLLETFGIKKKKKKPSKRSLVLLSLRNSMVDLLRHRSKKW